jgi:hypothetical protein
MIKYIATSVCIYLAVVFALAVSGCSRNGISMGHNYVSYENDTLRASVAKIETGTSDTTHIRGIVHPKEASATRTDVWGEVTTLSDGGKQFDVFARTKTP